MLTHSLQQSGRGLRAKVKLNQLIMAEQNPASNGVVPKGLRFYGRRKGRPLRQSMKRLLDESLPKFAYNPAVSVTTQFGRHVDCYLEIGFGGGEHLAGLAAAMPDCDFIGADPFINGVASLLRHIDEQQLNNIRIWPDDIRLILPTICKASLAGALSCFLTHGQNGATREAYFTVSLLDQLALAIRPGQIGAGER